MTDRLRGLARVVGPCVIGAVARATLRETAGKSITSRRDCGCVFGRADEADGVVRRAARAGLGVQISGGAPDRSKAAPASVLKHDITIKNNKVSRFSNANAASNITNT